MIIDIIALILVVFALFKGLRNGLVVALFSFLAFFVGLAAALKLSALAAGYLGAHTGVSQRWLPFLAFALVFLLVVLLVRLGAKAIEGMLKVVMLGWLNRIGGVVLYLVLYFFIFSILLFYALQLHLIREETAQASVIYPFIQPLAPKMISFLGVLLPFFKNMFSELEHFFDTVATQHAH
ncbi:MAG TPA: CvpA family protein [Flavisolibacter sp.]|jgi:membrane protein required for colicin V production|nr:CvpA family protein [Flavisolibacter sp.]